MTFLSRSTLLAAWVLLAAGPAAFAQTSSTAGSTPGSPAGSGSVAAAPAYPHNDTAARDANPRVPGATGQTIVKGDRSTIAGDSHATAEQKTGETSGGR